MLALPGASGVLAATGDEPASTGFWAAVDSVGKLYAIKGRQLADDVKTNYLQLAGGDPDDLDVPSAIIEDGFMDGGGEQPAGKASPEADPERAPEAAQQAAPATQDDTPTPVEAEAVETAPIETAPIETAPAETAPAAETAESRLPMTLPMSSPVRAPPMAFPTPRRSGWHSPKMVCRPSRWGTAFSVTKNWLPLRSGPLLAMPSIIGRSKRMWGTISSSKLPACWAIAVRCWLWKAYSSWA